MKHEKRINGKFIVLVLLVVILAVVCFMFLSNSKASVCAYVENHADALEEFAQSVSDTTTVGEETSYGKFEVTPWDDGMVEFFSGAKGFGSEMTYTGFYYTPDDTPRGFQGSEVEFVPHESGWLWQEENGDNRQYTEKIIDHWYWYEVHF